MADSTEPPVAPHLVEHEGDKNAGQVGYIKGTDYSLPYASNWSRIHDSEVKEGLLRHMNCGFLSSPGRPPTLLALKQHAQSLCTLIHALNPTLNSNEILTDDPTTATTNPNGDRNLGAEYNDSLTLKYHLNDAFDFLTDLSTPYYNDDPNHHKPLTGLMNEVRGRHEGYGTDYHCPLIGQSNPRAADEAIRPYASHHNLVMHANSCLERLDHEFSPVGGLMGLLPTSAEHDEEDLQSARASLLGQWLLFTQHLVGRMHELERSYGNALDALAGEAAIPHQYLAGLGPDVRAEGREIVFPQDRWILVNAGDDVFSHIHDLLDRREELRRAKDDTYKRNGVKSDNEWERDCAKGLVPVNLMTRYYRLAGQGRNTLFVVPGGNGHPGTTYSREIEAKPTVVSSVQPTFPKRVSELEKKYKEQFEKSSEIRDENRRLKDQAVKNYNEMKGLKAEREMLTKTREALLLAVNGSAREDEGTDKLLKEFARQKERAERAERKIEKLERQRESAVSEIDRLRIEIEGVEEEDGKK